MDSLRKLLKYLQVVFCDANTTADGNSFHKVFNVLGVTVKAQEMSVSIDLKSADFVGGVVVKLERLLEGQKLFLGEANASLKKRAPQVASVNGFLLVELQDVVHESLLGPAHASHDVSRDQSGKLEREVAFLLVSRGNIDELQDLIIDLCNLLMIHLRHTFNNAHSYPTDIFPLEVGLVLHQGLESLARREQAGYRLVHGKVGESHTQDFIAKVYESKGMVDEEVAAHQLVDEKLFHQGWSAVLREHASGWGLEGGDGERIYKSFSLLCLHLLGNIGAGDLLVLFENLR